MAAQRLTHARQGQEGRRFAADFGAIHRARCGLPVLPVIVVLALSGSRSRNGLAALPVRGVVVLPVGGVGGPLRRKRSASWEGEPGGAV